MNRPVPRKKTSWFPSPQTVFIPLRAAYMSLFTTLRANHHDLFVYFPCSKSRSAAPYPYLHCNANKKIHATYVMLPLIAHHNACNLSASGQVLLPQINFHNCFMLLCHFSFLQNQCFPTCMCQFASSPVIMDNFFFFYSQIIYLSRWKERRVVYVL